MKGEGLMKNHDDCEKNAAETAIKPALVRVLSSCMKVEG